MSIPQSFIQELLTRVDIVDIVGRHVPLRKGGANLMGLCPFHGEKSPSFSVSPAKQFYHCFGCGKNGNAISFLIEHLGMSFVEAVQDLAQQCGLPVPEDELAPEERAKAVGLREQQATLTSVLEKAAQAYSQQLRQSTRAIDYLKGRGLSGDIAKTFGLGYAPEGWRHLASVFPDYNDPLLQDSGLVISNAANEDSGSAADAQLAKRYDRFRDRIMFPIRNVKGQCIGFGGRVLDAASSPKYLNSPETPVFSKGRELYGLFEARAALREQGYALVTEGYMDVVALAQLGFSNAVATLGTACTHEHVQKLFRFTDAVVFSFDGDSAGQRAARKALEAALPWATDVRSVKFLFLPQEHDPDSYIRAHGQEGFAACISRAVPLSRFMLQVARENCDLDSAEGRAHMVSNARPLWSLLPEGALKRQLLAEIAEQVQIDSRELLQLWQIVSMGKTAKTSRPPSKHPSRNAAGSYVSEPAPDRPETHDAGLAPFMPAMPELPVLNRQVPRRLAGRVMPASREDRVLRLLLSESASWDQLSHAEHQVLLALPAPHGPLFAWLENQLHEYGPQSWAALREGLRGHAHEMHATAQMLQIPEGIEVDWAEARSVLKQLMRLRDQREMDALVSLATTDPQARQRYIELMANLHS